MAKKAIKYHNVGIGTSSQPDLTLKSKILTIRDYLTTDKVVLRKLIPETPGTRATNCYKLLILIYSYPRSTLGNIKGIINNNSDSNRRSVDYLVNLGYVKEIGKPRLIIPF